MIHRFQLENNTNLPPTVDELFGSPKEPLVPTVDQLFGSPQNQDQSSGGDFADYFYREMQPLNKIMSAYNQGAAEGWGSIPNGVEEWLNIQGPFTDYTEKNKSFIKSINETFIRPAINRSFIAPSILVAKTAMGALGGILKATEATGTALEEGGEKLLKSPSWLTQLQGYGVGMAGELLGSAPDRMPEFRYVPRALRARAHGVIGEGEQGYFNTVEPTQQALKARVEASREAGLPEPPKVQPPVDDIYITARKTAPYLFQEYEDLAKKVDNLRDSLAYLSAKRGEELDREITVILSRAGGDEAKLIPADKARLDNARARLEEARTTDTPEMAAARERLLEADYQLRDLAPEIAGAYKHAEELMPPAEMIAERKAKAAKKAESEATKEQAEFVDDGGNTPVSLNPLTGERRTVTKLTEIKGTGPERTRGLALRIEEEAIADGLTDGFSNLPEYKVLKNKSQFEQAADFVINNYDDAVSVSMLEKVGPKGVHPEAILRTLKAVAREKGDVATLMKLAKSELGTQHTTMGQRLQLIGAIDPTDPVAIMKHINERRSKVLDVEKKKVVKEIDEHMKKSDPVTLRAALETYIKSIEC